LPQIAERTSEYDGVGTIKSSTLGFTELWHPDKRSGERREEEERKKTNQKKQASLRDGAVLH